MYLSSTKKHKMKKKNCIFIILQIFPSNCEQISMNHNFIKKKKEKKKNEEGMNHNHPNLACKNQQLYNKNM